MKGIRSLLVPSAVALLAVGSALLLTLLLQPLLKPTIFLLFFAAVAVSAWYGGMKAGLLANALSTLAVSYFFLEPVFSLLVASLDSLVRLGLFVLVTIFISFLNSELRTAKQHLQMSLQKLQVSEARFRRLVESNIIGVIVANMDGAIAEANDAFLEMVGYSQEDLLAGRVRWRDMIPPEYIEANNSAMAELTTKGVCQPFENEYIRKDNSRVPILLGSALLENNPNDIISFVLDLSKQQAALRHVSDELLLRKQAELEREQMLEREQAARADAEAANRMKDEFLSIVSHELRTPLNAILGWTQLLRIRKFDEATTVLALETIERNTKSLTQLIEDVLDVSRIIRGTRYLSIDQVELVPLVKAGIDIVYPAAQSKEISINCKFDSEVGVVVGDANRLQQILWNLLSNAVKFTPKGGRVDVQLKRIESYVQIRVSDTGGGIAAEFLPHVFERFRQADSSTTRSHGGLGLGLAIVRHLVELHGGTVSAESPGIGQGATFVVTLPMKDR
ncbi:MAG: PAS domain-containing sensor histidine kinase [Nostoc sp.]